MPFFSGLAQGFSDAQLQDRQLQNQQDEYAAQRENSVLQLIATQHQDPAVRAAALSTILTPRKAPGGALGKFFDRAQQNPMMPRLAALMAASQGPGAPQTMQTEPGGATAQPAPPPAQGTAGSAALPAAAAGSAATPPPMNVAAVEQGPAATQPVGPGSMGGVVPAGQTAQVPGPRQAAGLRTQDQQLGLNKQAEIEGTVRGAEAAAGPPGPGQSGVDPALLGKLQGLPVSHTTDAEGNIHTFVGSREVPTQPLAGGTPAGKPTAANANVESEAQAIVAEAASRGQLIDPDAARAQALTARASALKAKQFVTELGPALAQTRLLQGQQSTLTQEARMESLRATTAATWQRVNGTVPMTREQALTTARQVLGNGPDVTGGDVGTLADSLFASTQPARQGGTAGPARPGGAAAPVPGVGGAAAAPPPAPGAAPAGRLSSAITAGGAANVVRAPKFYSGPAKTAVTAIGAVEALLPKIIATIKANGLENSNNPIPEKLSSLIYGMGVSPGADMEGLLQNAGMAKAYGLRGLLGGRSNQQLQGLYGQHLIDPGDSPKLIMEKAQTLLGNIPDIKKAIDDSENLRVGGHGATTPPPAPVTHPEGQRGTLNGKPVVWKTIPGKGSGWLPAPTGQ